MLLLNAFSINMLASLSFPVEVCFERVSVDEVKGDTELTSAVGHPDTARVLGSLLGRDVPCNRATVSLAARERAWVAQYIGPRLPEGATVLPDGARIEFFKITVD
jgi:hypothetical protein